jgi:hypothetical protein
MKQAMISDNPRSISPDLFRLIYFGGWRSSVEARSLIPRCQIFEESVRDSSQRELSQKICSRATFIGLII